MDRKLRKLRENHIKHGHPLRDSTRLDKLHSELHPSSNAEFIYTVNIMRCDECGLTWNDCGLEYRK